MISRACGNAGVFHSVKEKVSITFPVTSKISLFNKYYAEIYIF